MSAVRLCPAKGRDQTRADAFQAGHAFRLHWIQISQRGGEQRELRRARAP